jgi:hypothetical protein
MDYKDWVVDINEFRKITNQKIFTNKEKTLQMNIDLESLESKQEDIILTEPDEKEHVIQDTKSDLLTLLTAKLGLDNSTLYTSKITDFLQNNVGMTANKTKTTKGLMEIFKNVKLKGKEKKSVVQDVLGIVLKTNLDGDKLQEWAKNESAELIDELFELAPKLFTMSTATKVLNCLNCC